MRKEYEVNMSSGKRDSYTDFLKGIAVVAVIVGHSISNVPKVDFLFQIIYSFHMPLLIFISAYIEEENRGKYTGKESRMLLRRMSGLLLPYLSWTIIYIAVSGQLLNMSAVEFGFILIGYDQSGLWFFPVLFGLKATHFLYWVIRKKIRRCTLLSDMLLCIVLEMAVAALAVLTKQPYLVNMLSYAVPYFLAVVLVENEILQKLFDREWITAGTMLLYGAVFPLFSFHDTRWTTQVLRIGLSLCVITVCFRFRQRWKENSFNRIVCVYGRNSLAIYVLHGFFMDYMVYFNRIESAVVVILLAIAAACMVAVVSIAIARIIEISSWWRMVLLGERK